MSDRTESPERRSRKRFIFQGIIQGVGFRPAVFRTAEKMGLGGFVQNRRSEVVAEVEGSSDAVGSFLTRFLADLPGAASIDSVSESDLLPLDNREFYILESESDRYSSPPIPPDLALCTECASELLDPENRRYLYPFITCTQCGPRYSITENTPFDRERTSMKSFRQCSQCRAEYENPDDRRFHSQTNSCPVCGPAVSVFSPGGHIITETDPIRLAISALTEGKIVALQGIGGFHLAVDPAHAEGLARLRGDKERARKPFALMVRDIEETGRLCSFGTAERALLTGPRAPILILPKNSGTPAYLDAVSDTGTLGLMLPYTPLHLLLFRHPEAEIPYRHLVMTSGNRRGEPIVTDSREALECLVDAADFFLVHNRPIVFRTDDSVLRPACNVKPEEEKEGLPPFTFIRRSRGYVPKTIELPSPVSEPVIGAGGDLKSAPALALESSIYLSPYIGDIECIKTEEAYLRQVRQMLELYDVSPEKVVYDLHPGYFSSRWAEGLDYPRKHKVQHHYAHILSVMAEHGLEGCIGCAFDGTGYGTDGTVWGGEFLWVGRRAFTRLGSFSPFLLPGGEAAIERPKRTAFSLLAGIGRYRGIEGDTYKMPEKLAGKLGLSTEESVMLPKMLEKELNSPVTTSLGRIFDAAAAILGYVERCGYEGEGPIRMEGGAETWAAREGRGRKAERSGTGAETEDGSMREWSARGEELVPLEIEQESSEPGFFTLDVRPLLRFLLEVREKKTPEEAACIFHYVLAEAASRGLGWAAEQSGIHTVALSGGVFQNVLFTSLLSGMLQERGFAVYSNCLLPPGDGGLAAGQVYAL